MSVHARMAISACAFHAAKLHIAFKVYECLCIRQLVCAWLTRNAKDFDN